MVRWIPFSPIPAVAAANCIMGTRLYAIYVQSKMIAAACGYVTGASKFVTCYAETVSQYLRLLHRRNTDRRPSAERCRIPPLTSASRHQHVCTVSGYACEAAYQQLTRFQQGTLNNSMNGRTFCIR